MATITSEDQSVEVVIPAAYLEDVRTAIVAAIEDDGDMLSTNQQEVIDEKSYGPDDVDGAVRNLREDMDLLGKVLHVDGETTLSGNWGAVGHVLQRLARMLAVRLVDQAEYAPMPMRTVLDLTDRLQWALREAIRVAPSEFDHPKEA